VVQQSPLIFAAAGHPFPGELVSGDAWHIDWHASTCRIAVIDGLGHGPEAAAASEAATVTLTQNPRLPPASALEACHLALRGTRGAAMWVGSIDVDSGRLVYAGVGNVEARLWQVGKQVRLIGQRGIVGATLPHIRAYDAALADGWVLVVYTDGLRERFNLEDTPALVRNDPRNLADTLLKDWSRATDDALVVVIVRG
jgi:serine phosphatase RsbU (regulator of sigma subunit)